MLYRIKNILGQIKTNEFLISQHLNENLTPFWSDKISMREIDYKFSESGKKIGESNHKIDNRELQTSLIFENIVDDLYYLNLLLGKTYHDLNETIISLSKLLEKKIGEENY